MIISKIFTYITLKRFFFAKFFLEQKLRPSAQNLTNFNHCQTSSWGAFVLSRERDEPHFFFWRKKVPEIKGFSEWSGSLHFQANPEALARHLQAPSAV